MAAAVNRTWKRHETYNTDTRMPQAVPLTSCAAAEEVCVTIGVAEGLHQNFVRMSVPNGALAHQLCLCRPVVGGYCGDEGMYDSAWRELEILGPCP